MTKKKSDTPDPIVITLTIPEAGDDGSLLIQRGKLAHVSQFAYEATETDFTLLISLAIEALTVVEADPPVVPDPPPPKKTPPARQPAAPPEPTIQVPVKSKKKGGRTKTVLARCLLLPDDETAQQVGLKLAGKLLDSELWDGETPIRIADPAALKRKLQGLTTKEMKTLFTLEQFVEVNPPATTNPDPTATADPDPAAAEVQAN